MDGIKGVVPDSCKPLEHSQVTLFDDEAESTACPGCAKAIYSDIRDLLQGQGLAREKDADLYFSAERGK